MLCDMATISASWVTASYTSNDLTLGRPSEKSLL